MKIIDAHSHLPKDKKISSLLSLMDANNTEKVLLILNTKEDQEEVLKQLALLLQYKKRIGIAVGYDIAIPDIDDYITNLQKQGISCVIKLHSRIMQYTLAQIPEILKRLRNVDFNTIMVDGFDYGHHLENLINLELLVAVAEAFSEKNVVFAHAGGIQILKTMLCTRTLKNVNYDLSLTVPYLFNTSIKQDILHFLRFNHTKVMFGSDYPDFSIEESYQKFNILFQELGFTSEIIENVLYNNANRLYSEVFG